MGLKAEWNCVLSRLEQGTVGNTGYLNVNHHGGLLFSIVFSLSGILRINWHLLLLVDS